MSLRRFLLNSQLRRISVKSSMRDRVRQIQMNCIKTMVQEGITKNWRRDVWRDHLTLEVTQIEITPENDLQRHISSLDCDCLPVMKNQENAPMLVHNSFDGREVLEGYERGT